MPASICQHLFSYFFTFFSFIFLPLSYFLYVVYLFLLTTLPRLCLKPPSSKIQKGEVPSAFLLKILILNSFFLFWNFKIMSQKKTKNLWMIKQDNFHNNSSPYNYKVRRATEMPSAAMMIPAKNRDSCVGQKQATTKPSPKVTAN